MVSQRQKRQRRRRNSNSPQMDFPFDTAEKSYRTHVLAVINASSTWRTAQNIARAAGLTYDQTIFALNALFDNGKIARVGRKFTARWGPLTIEEKPESNFALLSNLFNSSISVK